MGRLLDLFEVPDRRNQEAVEAMLERLAEMDALIDEVAFLRCENAQLSDLLRRYQEDGAVFMDAKRYRVMVENGVVPSEWHEIITSAREGFRQRADEAFDEFVKALSDYEEEAKK